ncbi:MAG: GNAT family N-acetyltransferase [Candidatus Lokiarchaeota archaeon]|nr:GNAT family N-acetyltransferase [Candidatus Lokiarchaeota archaeon]
MSSQQSHEKKSLKRDQIRRFFSMPTFSLEEEDQELSVSKSVAREKPPEEGYPYVQMVLEEENLTSEFEEKLKKRIASQVKIRRAKEEDIPLLTQLYNRSFITAEDPYSPMKEEDMEMIFRHNHTIILISSIWGVDSGFIIIDFEEENGKKIGYICGLGTLPEWQQRGIGTTLGIASWAYFKNAGIQELRCEVYRKNKGSYNLIKGLGFKEKGIKYYKF